MEKRKHIDHPTGFSVHFSIGAINHDLLLYGYVYCLYKFKCHSVALTKQL